MADQPSKRPLKGSMVAIITPMANGLVDESAFQRLCDWQVKQGTSAIVPVGTTGESPTLSHDEHRRVVALCIEAVAGRVPVIAGAGSNSTAEAVAFSKDAERAGADAILSVAPYYNKPTQEGLYQHFKAVHDSCGLPVIIYNIPPRSVVDISVATFERLVKLPRIAGVKDATADLSRPLAMRVALGPDFIQLSGEDATALAFNAQGGHGCISVTANVAPKLLADMHAAWERGDIAAAQAINNRLMPLHQAMFCEASPGPVKYAAHLLDLCGWEARLPLVEIAESSKARVRAALVSAGLLGS